MGRELGRISGPLLAENLLRNGNNLAFDTNLIYLDVVNGWVGVKNSTPTRTLNINGTTNSPYVIADTSGVFANLEVTASQIQNVSGNITLSPNQSLNPTVNAPRLTTASFDITTNSISNTTLDSNITLDPMGTGQLVVTTTNVDIRGSLHATGNITWDGTVTLGNNDSDNVSFNADTNSNILPDITNSYNLGTSQKEWQNLYSQNITGYIATGASITANNINLTLSQGNIIYVSVNGNDSNVGTHQHATFLTLKHALSQATSGTTVYIYPGIYTEIFPLTVPQGVSVAGTGIRSVVINPTNATKFKDAFLLNGETTVEHLTVGNFYYSTLDNTGYGFRLAQNCLVTTRSPYVQNVTILNNTSPIDFQTIIDGEYSTSAIVDVLNGGDSAGVFADITDGNPLGTAAAAGRGALVDGSVVNANSKEATILFYAATFIIPNADGITLTNGARSEWLNSFTYFANIGIHLTQGTLGFASLGTRFGAEMRSINSVNVYGNYGAIADGANTLGYLIGHNFAYIGSGATYTFNNPKFSIVANQVVTLNNGKLYYDSIDQVGNYRIGDIFQVIQETGQIAFNTNSIVGGSDGSITISSNFGTTFIDKFVIQTGNINIHDNNVDSLQEDVNWKSSNGTINLNTNVNITGNLSTTGDVNIKGSLISFGDASTDNIVINDYLTQHILPKITDTYTLGTKANIWNILFATILDVDGAIQLTNNTVSTLTGNNNLRFVASGTGKIVVTTTDVDITNNLVIATNLTASGTSSFKNTTTNAILQSGSYNLTGNASLGVITSSGDITAANPLTLPTITINGSVITGTAAGSDLVLTPNTGQKVQITGPAKFNNNVTIATTLGVTGTTTLSNDVNTTAITQTGDFNQTGVSSASVTGAFQSTDILGTGATSKLLLPRVKIDGSSILGTYSDTDLQFTAQGTGKVKIADTARIDQNLSVGGILDVGLDSNFTNTTAGLITQTGNFNQTGVSSTSITGNLSAVNYALSGLTSRLDAGNFRISGQTIAGKVTNGNVTYTANGSGNVNLQGLRTTSSTISSIASDSNITLSPTNSDFQTIIDGEYSTSAIVDVLNGGDSAGVFADITDGNPNDNNTGSVIIVSNKSLVIPYGDNSNRILSSIGEIRQNSTTSLYEGWSPTGLVSFNNIYDSDRNTYITPELTPGANDNILRFAIDGTVSATLDATKLFTNNIKIGNINISGQTVSNEVTANNLEINPSGTGSVLINAVSFKDNKITNTLNSSFNLSSTGSGYVKFGGTGAVVFPSGPPSDRRLTPELGELRFNTNTNIEEIFDGQSWISVGGSSSVASYDDINTETNLWAFVLG